MIASRTIHSGLASRTRFAELPQSAGYPLCDNKLFVRFCYRSANLIMRLITTTDRRIEIGVNDAYPCRSKPAPLSLPGVQHLVRGINNKPIRDPLSDAFRFLRPWLRTSSSQSVNYVTKRYGR